METVEKHPLTAKYKSLFNKFNINTPLRLAHFMGQISAESGLKPIEENLRYSGKRILEVFGKYFPKKAEAFLAEYNPKYLADRVYSNRMGNGDWNSGDGYRFRGRGFIQLTGRNNYTALTKWAQNNGLNVDYVKNPDLLLTEADALISALWFWSVNNINQYADKDDILSVSRVINLGNAKSSGTPHGYENRKVQTEKFKRIFECK